MKKSMEKVNTYDKEYNKVIKSCWNKGQNINDFGINTTKCCFKTYLQICKDIIGCPKKIDDIIDTAVHIYEAIMIVQICEDFACQKFIRGKRKSEKWVENLPIEYFVYYSNGERCKVSAMEIIEGRFDNGKPINPYRIKTEIIGSYTSVYDYSSKNATVDY